MGWRSIKIAEKLVDYTNTTNVEFIVDPKVLFHGWLIYSYLHLSWSRDCQGSVQIDSLTTLWHYHIAFIDGTAFPGRKIAFNQWPCAERWTCTFKSRNCSEENPWEGYPSTPTPHLPRLGISLHRRPTVYNSLKCESLFITNFRNYYLQISLPSSISKFTNYEKLLG